MGTGASPTHCLIVSRRLSDDPRARGLVAEAHALGVSAVKTLECHELYFLEGDLSQTELQRLVTELLSDPIVQIGRWRSASDFLLPSSSFIVDVALRPGVTDPVADQIVRCAHLLGIQNVERAATGQRYVVTGELAEQDLHRLARRLLANDVIQRYALGEIEPVFPHPAEAIGTVEVVPIRELEDDELLALSRERRAALDLREMQAIQQYYRTVGRDPSDVEFETIAQTWSEHCVHKTFKARVTLTADGRPQPESDSLLADAPLAAVERRPSAVVDGILRTYIRAATETINASWVRSAFVDNAGIIDFDDEYDVSFKVETHNHPSAIEPFGGANTGVGGVIRDVLGVSAKPIAATDVLCFGPQNVDPASLPEGVLHPRRVRSGVVAGVQDYGNKIGIPTVSGAILYDAGYTANPLVFCGCVGLAPKGVHQREPRAGDRVVILGGRTGRDGLRGATFSSMTMDAQTGEVAGASVQIGDPITEKGVIEVVVRARIQRLYHAITDCGAGGLSSAVGEMASHTGADVELRQVRLKYPGLAPWEIWLSEAQERMVLAVPPSAIVALQSLCATFDVELTDIGVFTDTGRLIVRYDGRTVLELENDFLHAGLPQRALNATVAAIPSDAEERSVTTQTDPVAHLLTLLASPNIASKADVIRVYDHEVQGGTVVKPLTGVCDDGPSDAVVIKPLGTKGTRGIVLSCGINPEYGKRDAYHMAVSVVDEAIRNAVAAGADPARIALLDNFCWGDPNRPETLGALVEAARGCHDAALHYAAPFISGKDSLNNEYVGADGLLHAIPPTLLVSAIGIIEDVSHAVSTDLKEGGNVIYLVGALPDTAHPVPRLPAQSSVIYASLHRAMQSALVRACHDLSEGGLAVAAAEMCIGGRLGMSLDLRGLNEFGLFAEANGLLLTEVRPNDCAAFESCFNEGAPIRIGSVVSNQTLSIMKDALPIVSLSVDTLRGAWQGAAQ